jgi:hypothetical protein
MSLIEKAKQFISDKLDALSQLSIGWDNRPYDFYLIFGDSEESRSPWLKSNWQVNFEPYFDSLINQIETSKETGIRVVKYNLEKRIAKKDGKEFTYHSEIKLGRLRWDSQSHEKWTTLKDSDNYFLNLEVWTPIWTNCEKRNSPPDFFISITNEKDFENKRHVQFGYFIVVAIAKNLNIDSKPILAELSAKINSKVTILKTRKWGKPEKSGNWTFVNSIQDTFSNGIYKGQNLHSFDFNELEFEPAWEMIYRQR